MNALKRILLVGYGLVGRVHAEIIDRSPSAQLCSVLVPNKDLKKYKSAKHFKLMSDGDLEEVMARVRPDGVIISSPTAFHANQILTCISSDIPFLVEKPAVTSSKQFYDQLDAVGVSDIDRIRCMVGHHRIYGEIFQEAKKILSSGRLGQIISVAGITHWYKPDAYFEEAKWRTDKEHLGGVLGINLIHEIATLIKLLGPIDEVAAFGKKNRGYSVIDTAAVSMMFANGAVGTWSVSDCVVGDRSWEHNSLENEAFPHTPHSSIFIGGKKASLDLPRLTLVHQKSAKKNWWKETLREPFDELTQSNPLFSQFESFLNLIDGKDPDIVSLKDGLLYILTLECIQKALVTENTVKVDWRRYA